MVQMKTGRTREGRQDSEREREGGTHIAIEKEGRERRRGGICFSRVWTRLLALHG